MKKFGFTLAEVLVTLSIVGIISALTLPQLTKNHAQQTAEAQIKKFYGSLVNGIDKYLAQNEVEALDEVPGFTPANFATSTYRVSICGTQANGTITWNPTAQGCFATSYKYVNGTDAYANADAVSTNAHRTSGGVYKMDDGTVFSIGYPSADNNGSIDLTFDINGPKGPNKVGFDLWSLNIAFDGTVSDRDRAN